MSAKTMAAGEGLGAALADIVRRPVTNLLGAWNWKTAMISVVIRATLFFTTNLRAGRGSALRASLVEAGFAIFAAGLLGAVTQRVRHAQPVWATGLTVWLGVPVVLLSIQSTVHRAFGTPHMKTGLIVSFCMAAVGSGFNWYAQQRGVLVTGAGAAGGDLQALPRVILDFVMAGPRALAGLLRGNRIS
jgi:hypothetical protein